MRGTESGYDQRADLCFIGSYQHPPNIDAAVYFIEEVLPLIKNAIPDIKFYSVGSNPPENLTALANEDVVITGFVEDLDALMDKVRVAVAPLRYGAGIKGKIGTTLAAGLPCVATMIAAEGMEMKDGEEILIAEDPETFADAVVKIYRSRELWEKISQNGIRFSDKMFGMAGGVEITKTILGSIGLGYAGSLSNLRPNKPSAPAELSAAER